jgi:hypothetical protein
VQQQATTGGKLNRSGTARVVGETQPKPPQQPAAGGTPKVKRVVKSMPPPPPGAHASFTYSVDAMRQLPDLYRTVLESMGARAVSSPSSSNVIFLSQHNARTYFERPGLSSMELRHDARVLYLSGETHLLDHVLRHDLYCDPSTEVAVAYRDGLAQMRGVRWLLRPRVGPIGPRCSVQDLNMPIWYDPELIAIRIPDDAFSDRDMMTVMRTCVLVTGSGQVYVAAEGETLYYDPNNLGKPPRQEQMHTLGLGVRDVFEDGLRPLFKAFFSSSRGEQMRPLNQCQVFWADAFTRRVGSRLVPWWIELHAVPLNPASRSMFVGGAADRTLLKKGRAWITSRIPHYRIDLTATASMLDSCLGQIRNPNASLCVFDHTRRSQKDGSRSGRDHRSRSSRDRSRSSRDRSRSSRARSKSKSRTGSKSKSKSQRTESVTKSTADVAPKGSDDSSKDRPSSVSSAEHRSKRTRQDRKR